MPGWPGGTDHANVSIYHWGPEEHSPLSQGPPTCGRAPWVDEHWQLEGPWQYCTLSVSWASIMSSICPTFSWEGPSPSSIALLPTKCNIDQDSKAWVFWIDLCSSNSWAEKLYGEGGESYRALFIKHAEKQNWTYLVWFFSDFGRKKFLPVTLAVGTSSWNGLMKSPRFALLQVADMQRLQCAKYSFCL